MEYNSLQSGKFSEMLGQETPLHQQQTPPNPPYQPSQPNYIYSSYNPPWKSKQQTSVSDEDEPGDNNDAASDGKRNTTPSPWQRMKWTDNMVRLLIMAVYYIGDESVVDQAAIENGKKKPGSGLLQKKGKWKSVSRAMLEKGFYVSPQQCEDKFNDLNKRYKRVNDILGRGTACQVVENQGLLESMDLSPKLKEEARKLLNSKHLFFREMCAYHNSCGHGAVQAPSRTCTHTSELANCREEEDEDDEEESEDEDFEDDNEDPSKRRKLEVEPSLAVEELTSELATVMQDPGKSCMEKKEWIKVRMVQLEEQQLGHRLQAFELEKQRLKWVRFSGKKEREMERAKLENERKRLESERMMLMVRQKELELFESQRMQQQSSNSKRGDVSSFTS